MDGTMKEASTTRRSKLLPKEELVMCDWDADVMGTVITVGEAAYMWDMSQKAVKNAAIKCKLIARRSFTGGDWLVSYQSMVSVYGQPKEDVLTWLKSK